MVVVVVVGVGFTPPPLAPPPASVGRWDGGGVALVSRAPEPKVKPIPIVDMTDDNTDAAEGDEAA
jgi:hypothetical protein